MGGVNLLDHTLYDSRPVIHRRKWYWPSVINAINIAFVYTWRMYRIVSCETIRQKDFRWYIVGIIIRKSKSRVISVDSRPIKPHKVANEVRYDGLVHYPISCSVWKCAVFGKSCRNSCEKYKRSLYVKTWFQIFHEK